MYKNLIIEFVGMPGVGKSTVAECLHRGLVEEGVESKLVPFFEWVHNHQGSVKPEYAIRPGLMRRVGNAARLLQIHFWLLSIALWQLPRHPELIKPIRMILGWLRRAGADQQVGVSGINIMDEGVLNYLGNIMVGRGYVPSWLVHECIRLFTVRARRITVFVECDEINQRDRWWHRTRSSGSSTIKVWGYRVQSNQEVSEMYAEAKRFLAMAKTAVRKTSEDLFFVVLDGNQGPEANADLLFKHIQSVYEFSEK